MNLDILKDYSEIEKISLLLNLNTDTVKKLLNVGFTFKGSTFFIRNSVEREKEILEWSWSNFSFLKKKKNELVDYTIQIYRREETFQYHARPNDLILEIIENDNLVLKHVETCENPINTDIIPMLIKIENYIKCI